MCIIFFVQIEYFSSPVRECSAVKNKGHVCGAASKIRSKAKIQWYYDAETAMCLAFKYNGCGGNRNRFDTVHQCEFRCIPREGVYLIDIVAFLEDYGWCALSKEAYKDSGGQTRICFKRNLNNTQECPQGYACKMLAFFGVCCPKRTEGLFFFSLAFFV
uniref:BPTI/Kunitz inhibitor domain-containing protein n=1 Tax=Ascaris lumbricoides TaxID=6252 RepID=A0A0M3HFU6_ASCLU